MDQSIHILHVDDDPDFADMVSKFLRREDERFEVRTAIHPKDALEIMAETDFDCIVSDYNMPGQNGIEFLRTVREDYPDLPFILYTGKGSEVVASEAISAGVTDYLQKGSGSSQYTVLANRIVNSVNRFHSQSELADREKRLNLFFEQSLLGEIRWNDDFNFARVNEKAEDILGYTEEELIGKPWEIVVPEENREETADVVSDLLANQGGYHSINENVRQDGERIVCEWYNRVITDDTGDVIAIFSQFQDVTERRENQRELKKARERFQTIFEATNDAIFILDPDNETIVDANPEATKLLGYSREELVSSVTLRDIHPADMAQYREFLDQVRTEEIGRRSDFQCVTKAGEPKSCEISVSSADFEDGQYMIAVVRDVSDRKQRERRLEQFASMVSHDLRSPLQVAEGYLELAQEECDSKHLEAIEDAHDRMATLIDDVLTFAREDEPITGTVEVDLAAVVNVCWANIETGDATLVADIKRPVLGDESRLQQLFENLFLSAVKHGGSDVTVWVGELEDGFYVEDDGHGIPDTEREKVFGAGYSTTANGTGFGAGYSTTANGTGFGLNIVKQVVEAHDWDVELTRSSEGGTRFEITGIEFADE